LKQPLVAQRTGVLPWSNAHNAFELAVYVKWAIPGSLRDLCELALCEMIGDVLTDTVYEHRFV